MLLGLTENIDEMRDEWCDDDDDHVVSSYDDHDDCDDHVCPYVYFVLCTLRV